MIPADPPVSITPVLELWAWTILCRVDLNTLAPMPRIICLSLCFLISPRNTTKRILFNWICLMTVFDSSFYWLKTKKLYLGIQFSETVVTTGIRIQLWKWDNMFYCCKDCECKEYSHPELLELSRTVMCDVFFALVFMTIQTKTKKASKM